VTATTDLPIAGIAIPTDLFFATAAWLAAILHTYLHVFLLTLWDALAEAPPGLGRLRLADRVFPWLVNDWALRRLPDNATTPRPMDRLADRVTDLVIWWATPLLLVGFWWRSMPAHSAWLTLIIAGALGLSLFTSVHGWHRAKARLSRPGTALASGNLAPPPIWRRLGIAVGVFLIALSLLRTEIGAIRIGPLRSDAFLLAGIDLAGEKIAQRPADWRDREIARRRFHVEWCHDNGLPPQACEHDLPETQAHARAIWCVDNAIDSGDCRARFATLDGAFVTEWREERRAEIANIVKPDLNGRDLRAASAPQAFIAGVDLTEAHLEGADLKGAQLEGANLRSAHLQGAYLVWARLQSAEWVGATIGASPAHSPNCTSGLGLTQSQLDLVIGDDATILPLDAETGEQLHVWSCWEDEAAAAFVEIITRHHDKWTADALRRFMMDEGWLCGERQYPRPEGDRPRRTGRLAERTGTD